MHQLYLGYLCHTTLWAAVMRTWVTYDSIAKLFLWWLWGFIKLDHFICNFICLYSLVFPLGKPLINVPILKRMSLQSCWTFWLRLHFLSQFLTYLQSCKPFFHRHVIASHLKQQWICLNWSTDICTALEASHCQGGVGVSWLGEIFESDLKFVSNMFYKVAQKT